MAAVKGMVALGGRTYRVSRLYSGHYEVVRILDDRHVGTFDSIPKLSVSADGIEPELLSQIALLALRQGKLSWTAPLARL